MEIHTDNNTPDSKGIAIALQFCEMRAKDKRFTELMRAWVDVNEYPDGTKGYKTARKVFEPNYTNG